MNPAIGLGNVTSGGSGASSTWAKISGSTPLGMNTGAYLLPSFDEARRMGDDDVGVVGHPLLRAAKNLPD